MSASKKTEHAFYSFISFVLIIAFSTGIFRVEKVCAEKIFHVNTSEKNIALTFDDGPHPKYTPIILDILKKYGIKATFFQIGQNIVYYKSCAVAVADAGHEIGNHTFSHTVFKNSSEDAILKEIEKTDELIYSVCGKKPVLFRPPQGFCTEKAAMCIKNCGYRTVLWNLDTEDWRHRSPDDIYNYIMNNVRGGDIILFHDYISGENTTIESLEKVIPALIERGYGFMTVSELLSNSNM